MTARNVAIFASAFAPHIGGVEELSRQLALTQQSRGSRPVVVTMRWPKSLPAEDEVDGIPVLRHVFRVPEPSPRFLAGWLLHSRRTQRTIADQLRERQIDLIHVQCVSNNAGYALAAARTLRLPLVVSMQGELTMDATGLYQRSSQQRRSWRRLLDGATAVTGCSQSVLDDAQAEYDGAWVQRATVVPNGVRVADFIGVTPRDHARPYVFALGRLVAQKGFDVLLRSWQKVATSSETDLLIAGDGPERHSLHQLATDLGLADRVRFVGELDRAATAAAFAGAALFVLPSRREPQGIVVLEAMASGVPVVATNVGGVPATVDDGANGLLVPAGDPAALATTIDRLLDDPDLRRRLADAGRQTAARHDWSAIADRYDAVYG